MSSFKATIDETSIIIRFLIENKNAIHIVFLIFFPTVLLLKLLIKRKPLLLLLNIEQYTLYLNLNVCYCFHQVTFS